MNAGTNFQQIQQVSLDTRPMPRASHFSNHGFRVLLVEDNEDHRILMCRALEARGHKVTPASSAAEALAALKGGEFEVAMVDYQLPDASGLEVLQEIRRRAAALPIVMVTGMGSEQTAVTALKQGARDYVVKTPGFERELPRALELAVEHARSEAVEATLQAELEHRAKTDCLTGLLNRGEMERLLTDEIQGSQSSGHAFSFALIDMDNFKKINDTLGHPAGDVVLCHLASLLRESLRPEDAVARWGGDEFAALLPEADFRVSRSFAERVLGLSQTLYTSSEGIIPPLTISLGLVTVPGRTPDLITVLKWADRALYAAKGSGRGTAKFFVLGEGEEVKTLQDHPFRPERSRRGRRKESRRCMT